MQIFKCVFQLFYNTHILLGLHSSFPILYGETVIDYIVLDKKVIKMKIVSELGFGYSLEATLPGVSNSKYVSGEI